MSHDLRTQRQIERPKPSPPPSYAPNTVEGHQVAATIPGTQIISQHRSAPAQRASGIVTDNDQLDGRDTPIHSPIVGASLLMQPPPLSLPPPHQSYPPPHPPHSPPHQPYSSPHQGYSPSLQPYSPSLQPYYPRGQSDSSGRLSGSTSSARGSDVHSPVEEHEERNGTVKYTFKAVGPNAMVLLPPSSVQGRPPKYYISVFLNCFMPLSHITTVYRGPDENASRVCEFEMGILSVNRSSRIRMGDYSPHFISDLFKKDKHNRDTARWTWKLPHRTSLFLTWDVARVIFTCSATVNGAPAQLVARFTSHIQPVPEDYHELLPSASVLEILPAGRSCFDDILVSLLILERKRLTPTAKLPLFNY